ncbi:hypothetical protein [Paenibacillus sp. FSL H7-0714]|uniref:hypothetical protein n=1 Tax=Paenibacillus sp. FSL H7-0714 TaxID=2954735 RepID=UPI0030F73DC5
MQTTGNLGLKKPEGTDIVDIADLNGNMDILDNAVNGKVDKVTGKQLSTNDYTAAEKTKLAGIAAGATNYVHPATHPPAIITQDASNRFVTDTEKTAWNAKETPTGAQAKADAAVAAAKADYIRQPGYAATSGTATAYTAVLTPAPTTTPDGFGITIVPHVTNGASPTLSVNGLAATPLKDQKGVAFAAGKLLVGKPYTFRKVGTDFLAASGGGGEYGTATAADVLAGKTIGTENNGVVNGTIPVRNATNGVGGTGHHTATESSVGVYTSGDTQNYVYVRPNPSMSRVAYEGDTWVRAAAPDLIPQNLLAGKTVLGMAGAIAQKGQTTASINTAWDGNNLWARIPLGAYLTPGGTANTADIQIPVAQARADGNIQSGNIRNGVWVYGVQGTLQPKLYAEGVSSNVGSNGALYVEGLAFRPKVVIVYRTANGTFAAGADMGNWTRGIVNTNGQFYGAIFELTNSSFWLGYALYQQVDYNWSAWG